jgi:hypothetical protein
LQIEIRAICSAIFKSQEEPDDFWPPAKPENNDPSPRLRIKTMDSLPSLLIPNDASRQTPLGNLARMATPFVRLATAIDPDMKPKPRLPAMKIVEEVSYTVLPSIEVPLNRKISCNRRTSVNRTTPSGDDRTTLKHRPFDWRHYCTLFLIRFISYLIFFSSVKKAS